MGNALKKYTHTHFSLGVEESWLKVMTKPEGYEFDPRDCHLGTHEQDIHFFFT